MSAGITVKEIDYKIDDQIIRRDLQIIMELLKVVVEKLDEYEDRLTAGGL